MSYLLANFKRLYPETLRTRLAIFLIIAVLTPIVLLGFISYYWIYRVQIDKVQMDLQSILDNETTQMQGALDDLSRASQLLTNNGGIGEDVLAYASEKDMYKKAKLFQGINKSIDNIYFSSPSIGFLFFYMPGSEGSYFFSNEQVRSDFSARSLPVFLHANKLTYYGIHPTAISASSGYNVLSLVRTLEDDEHNPVMYVYLESREENLKLLLSQMRYSMSVKHVVETQDGRIAYSDLPQKYPIGTSYGKSTKTDQYKEFSSSNPKGWKMHVLVTRKEYMHEVNRWRFQFLSLSILSVLVTALLFFTIWKMVYRPMYRINLVISRFDFKRNQGKLVRTGMREFDAILQNFYSMSDRIIDLLDEVETKERKRGQLEVEKLLIQINPHFIQNTLNTIQWISRMNGQTEIVRLVTLFTNVLHYNLGKKNIMVTVEEELAVLRDYVELQSIRYDFHFEVNFDVDQSLLQVQIPRFILQPLVENALYHGLNHEKGSVQVMISYDQDDWLRLAVHDNGQGMSQEQLTRLLENDERSRKTGLGIGLRYVTQMVDFYYGGRGRIDVQSTLGEGTSIMLVLPPDHKGGNSQ
ncbi:sensor histidine kinase [Paenibacillus sp. CF384]|uniref:sensor histidine kinase n=1 Tax=Paenibacillus sp. CF384 TaxID=1884382 RepID=UPI000894EE89|nr:histidine kinase [Paenibacillus sp. CF384]SDW48441.1 two-component system, sensor histidine kinase YesM [Paenibacillus sp. CF384]